MYIYTHRNCETGDTFPRVSCPIGNYSLSFLASGQLKYICLGPVPPCLLHVTNSYYFHLESYYTYNFFLKISPQVGSKGVLVMVYFFLLFLFLLFGLVWGFFLVVV